MAREHVVDGRRPAHETAVDPAVEEAASNTTFVTDGALPPVESTFEQPTPSASERAYTDPGAQALDALIASGDATPEAVVAIIDEHRSEHDALMAMVEQRLGAEFVAKVRDALASWRASIDRREIVHGNPADPEAGYFLVSAEEQGARWRTDDGRFTGTINRDGLDSRYLIDEDDALHARIGTDRTGTLAWERDGQNMGELYGRYGGSNDYEAGVRRGFEVGDGHLTAGVRHRVDGNGTTDGVFGVYEREGLRAEGELGVRDGALAESLSVTTRNGNNRFSGTVAHDARGFTVDAKDTYDFGGGYSATAHVRHTPEATTGSLAGAYRDDNTNIDANVTRGRDRTSFHFGVSERVTPELTLSGAYNYVHPDVGEGQSTLRLSERYRSGNLLHGVDLEGGWGARDYLRATGSVDAQLADRLYGSAWGTSEFSAGHAMSGQLGASLTFTTAEKQALTLAGLIDQDGNLETRLQYDVFKSRIDSISALDKNKKSALVSVFLSYSQNSGQRRLDNRFGEPTFETGPGNQFTAGIRIRF